MIKKPSLQAIPFVLARPDHGRKVVAATNQLAEKKGIHRGMVVADARAIIPSLEVLDQIEGRSLKLLTALAEWCIRFTPFVALDEPDGLIFEATGCPHLWGGEQKYLDIISARCKQLGYEVRIAMAETIGAAWAVARFGKHPIVAPGQQTNAILPLPPSALRLEYGVIERLHKVGLRQVSDFLSIPRPALRRRFGKQFLLRIDQATGNANEIIKPIHLIEPFQQRLPCLEPIVTAVGIEVALTRVLEELCARLKRENKGLRSATFKCYRVDGKVEAIEIGTNHPSNNPKHLFKLFEIKISTIEPALGIDLFVLEAQKVEEVSVVQEKIWERTGGLYDMHLAELLDRLAGKIGTGSIRRYLPDEHYWPERSVKAAASLTEKAVSTWPMEKPRPIKLLSTPAVIEVTAPIPDYPPMMFRYKGKLHKILKADGPERIEQEWWLQQGQHRDYYSVEDENGCRYWLFRLGHYEAGRTYQWFVHGFFP